MIRAARGRPLAVGRSRERRRGDGASYRAYVSFGCARLGHALATAQLLRRLLYRSTALRRVYKEVSLDRSGEIFLDYTPSGNPVSHEAYLDVRPI